MFARSLGFALRTTFIVGFPGETEEDFEELMAFCRDVRFDRMGAFAFSPEEDTAAALMEDQVPEEVKKQRLDRLMSQQAVISREQNERRVGSTCRVLVTGRQAGLYTGRSAWEAPDADGFIRFESKSALKPGEFTDVMIAKADTYDLTGAAVEDLP